MNDLRKQRATSTGWVLMVMAAAIGLFLWSPDLLRLYDPQAGDLGVDILQPAFVAAVYVCMGVVFSAVLAAFVERQLKEQSFGPWLSRYAVLFVLLLLCFCWVAAAIL